MTRDYAVYTLIVMDPAHEPGTRALRYTVDKRSSWLMVSFGSDICTLTWFNILNTV